MTPGKVGVICFLGDRPSSHEFTRCVLDGSSGLSAEQLGRWVCVLLEVGTDAATHRPAMNKAVARLGAAEAASGLADHAHAVARSDKVAQLELEAVPCSCE